ncbi:MAG: peptidoglycan DD-metalloendopeptidase family protein [Bacteroidia bacterium]|nr:peptidoglycan DD-metalloendopeptidase family protein [Bacteroidia bacterium]
MCEKRYKLFLILTIALFLAPSFGFASGGNDKTSGGGGDASDSLGVVSSISSTNETKTAFVFKRVLDDNLGQRMNPSEIKRVSWDTVDINIYKVDMSTFTDTVSYTIHDPAKDITFSMPVNGEGRVTSGFGYRSLHGRNFHYGVDIDLETGDPVMAAMGGIVRIARYSGGYGNFVVISHQDGLETLYGHMSALNVKEGQQVKSGEVIGLGGSTGHSTGSHLHFEFRIFGEQINPSRVFSFQEGEAAVVNRVIKVDQSWFSHVAGASKSRYHEVEEGETLDDIADLYSVSKSVLIDINRLDSETIEPGTRIRYQ